MFLKRLRCKHKNLQTITNIYGDSINFYDARSIVKCLDCGKEFRSDRLDLTCKRSNKFDLKEFHFKAESIDDISDGSHTFNDLYYQRMMLFAFICNEHKDMAWKSKLHDDGTMYADYFIVGINTPEGDFRYHYELKYWDLYEIKELERAPIWDGGTEKDITRLFSLLK